MLEIAIIMGIAIILAITIATIRLLAEAFTPKDKLILKQVKKAKRRRKKPNNVIDISQHTDHTGDHVAAIWDEVNKNS
ncbi:MAG: hypothetical protein J1E83_07650 [Lachnospiraceae bacterium]|nr:hypothetical protein [Lachnospiraceae bacterium]